VYRTPGARTSVAAAQHIGAPAPRSSGRTGAFGALKAGFKSFEFPFKTA
jgi:hypothetical protein